MHDDTVDRTTDGSGRITEMTLAQVRGLRASAGWGGVAVPPEPVPTLREALKATGGRSILVIEVKPKGIEEAVLSDIDAEDARAWVWVRSFYRSVVRRFHELAPSIPGALLCAGFDRWSPEQFLEEVRAVGAAAVSIEIPDLTGEIVELSHRLGLSVVSYDKERPGAWEQQRAWGVDVIVTDDPAGLLAFRDGRR